MVPRKYHDLVNKLSQVPESASLVLRELSKSDQKSATRVSLQESIILGRRSEAIQAIDILLDSNFIKEIDQGIIDLGISSSEATYLSGILDGYTYAIENQHPSQAVLTYPKSPSKLECELPKTGPESLLIQNTQQVFAYLAETAKKSLVVVTPFLDKEGAEVILGMFLRAKDADEKFLVLRFLEADSSENRYPKGYPMIASKLKELGVSVINYSIERPGTNMLETFHAKIVLSDSKAAYVGSSNFNRFSFDNSMELGVLVKDSSVKRIATIIDTLIKIGKCH